MTDRLKATDGSYTAEVASVTDYYAFGMAMPGRSFNGSDYRYGFNGKEKDQEGEFGSMTTYDFDFRIYNPGIAKFLSVGPLTKSYPMLAPYQFSSNVPTGAIDLDGLDIIYKELENFNKTIDIIDENIEKLND
ncbi:RHS repeat-associated core domain-containing protein [Marivirga tractuosa]|uniref:RHS repeat-associated core domain-containing protein n=1 Tax=Marivirga tractuosa TaxID=1006 RepID=UPI0011D196AC|nr:RHS repeat-associated core domain-containing protein [Marivirga tractuosa]